MAWTHVTLRKMPTDACGDSGYWICDMQGRVMRSLEGASYADACKKASEMNAAKKAEEEYFRAIR